MAPIRSALIDAVLAHAPRVPPTNRVGSTDGGGGVVDDDEEREARVVDLVLSLDSAACPRSLEVLGDDNTLIIPKRSFNPMFSKEEEDGSDESTWSTPLSFPSFLRRVGININAAAATYNGFMEDLWSNLAEAFKSPRVVRKGEIDPASPVRESCCKLLWLSPSRRTTREDVVPSPCLPSPSSPTWITVTEQGIRQSFDVTRVMFCRGNITEKIRFGDLVQEGEAVFDMYGGIGYFTLPALVHGKAGHVTVCEWNEYAVEALRYNLQQNRVDDRATVYYGDCRVVAKERNLCDMFDRVSLGLLPSSEGGWQTAVRALRRSTGGWLHVHGNVPVNEAELWQVWLCTKLRDYAESEGLLGEWVVLSTHLEKVKSFAPTVAHFVADVFLGPPSRLPDGFNLDLGLVACVADGRVSVCPKTLESPSSALSPSGILNQSWMR